MLKPCTVWKLRVKLWNDFLYSSLLRKHTHKCKMSEIHTLRSNQEETDTRIILYFQHAEKEGYQSAVVRSPDSGHLALLCPPVTNHSCFFFTQEQVNTSDCWTSQRLPSILERSTPMPYLVYTASLEKIVRVPSKGKVNLAFYGSCKSTLDSKKCLLSLVQNGNWTQKYKLT